MDTSSNLYYLHTVGIYYSLILLYLDAFSLYGDLNSTLLAPSCGKVLELLCLIWFLQFPWLADGIFYSPKVVLHLMFFPESGFFLAHRPWSDFSDTLCLPGLTLATTLGVGTQNQLQSGGRYRFDTQVLGVPMGSVEIIR